MFKANITKIAKLFRCRFDDLASWNLSPAAARRSFLLMILVLPVYIFTITLLAEDDFKDYALEILTPLLASDYILQWVLFPLTVLGVMRLIRLPENGFPAFTIITNHVSAMGMMTVAGLAIIYSQHLLDEVTFAGLVALIYIIANVVISIWSYILLNKHMGFAILVFVLNSFISKAISITTLTILKNYSAA